mmetsp:Transcript_27865/g.45350  ORF Transcript_27865/g.45350 Transcript_27865/m.45350 type:complete len:108 (-) Transcript_27865:336-659(-)
MPASVPTNSHLNDTIDRHPCQFQGMRLIFCVSHQQGADKSLQRVLLRLCCVQMPVSHVVLAHADLINALFIVHCSLFRKKQQNKSQWRQCKERRQMLSRMVWLSPLW